MPQDPAPMKLYRWISDGMRPSLTKLPDQMHLRFPITRFLNPRLVEKGDTRLYVEAHVVSRRPCQFSEWALPLEKAEGTEKSAEEQREAHGAVLARIKELQASN